MTVSTTFNGDEIRRRLTSQVYAQANARAWKMGDAIVAKGVELLTGPRSGRRYRGLGGRWYQASAAGELPAERSSRLRHSGRRNVEVKSLSDGGAVMNVVVDWTPPYAERLAAIRPQFPRAILEAAKPELRSIAHRKYLTGGAA